MSKKKNPRRVRTDATERSKKPFARHETDYEGVWYRVGTHRGTGKKENIYYVVFNRGGKRIETRVGREKQDGMTASLASRKRAEMIDGKMKPRKELRKDEAAEKDAETSRWTFDKLWAAWKADPENKDKRGTFKADQKFKKHLKVPFGEREPSELKPLDIDRLRLSLAEGHSRETTISVIGLIRRIERYGASGMIWTGDPDSKERCAGLAFPIILKGKKLGRDPRKKRGPSEAEYWAYIRECCEWPDVQAGNFQLFVALTGIRRGSVQNLKWTDLYLDDKRNMIALLRDSKTGNVSIVLSNDAIHFLQLHPKTEGVDYVFTGSDPDGRRSQRQIDREPRKVADAAGWPKTLDPCHAFRRHLATRLKKFGPKVGMAAGGWKSPAMLLHYQSTDSEEILAALNESGRKTAEKKQTA